MIHIAERSRRVVGRTSRFLVSNLDILALIALAVGVRLNGLDRWSLWLDETVQYFGAAGEVGTLYGRIYPQESFLSFLICRGFIELGLDGEIWILRFPFMLFGALTVVAIWLLARELLDRRSAWLAGILACVCPILVVYSQEYRFYSLLSLLTCVSAYALVVALRTNNPLVWTAFVIASLLNLYNHFLAFLALGSLALWLGIWLLVTWRGTPRMEWLPRVYSAIGAFVMIGVGYLPGIPWLARFLSQETPIYLEPLPLDFETFVRIFGTYFGLGDDWRLAFYFVLALIGAGCLFWKSPKAALLLLVWIVLPLAVFAFRGGARLAVADRYVIFIVPAYLLLIAAGVGSLVGLITGWLATRFSRSWYALAAGAAASVIIVAPVMPLLFDIYETNHKQVPTDLRAAYARVAAQVKPDDLLLQGATALGGGGTWFIFYDSYFLRPSVWEGTKMKLYSGDLAPRVGDYAKKKGSLWALVVFGPSEKQSLLDAGAGFFDAECFERICLLRATEAAGGSMRQRMRTFTERYAMVFPDSATVLITLRALEGVAGP